jgi:hypothetical protein
VVGVLAIFLAVSAAMPAEPTAAQHFEAGMALSNQGDAAGALREFQEAYRIAPAWQVLYNLAVVHEKLGEAADSLESFERYLQEGGRHVPPARRKQVDQEVSKLRQEVGWLALEVNGARALEVDGVEREVSGHLYVMPGRHRVGAVFETGKAHADVEVHRGERVVVALAPPAAPPAPTVPVVVAPEPAVTHAPPPAPPVVLVPAALPEPTPAVASVGVEASPVRSTPWYGHWYVWAAVGVVAAGTVTAICVASQPRVDIKVPVP